MATFAITRRARRAVTFAALACGVALPSDALAGDPVQLGDQFESVAAGTAQFGFDKKQGTSLSFHEEVKHLTNPDAGGARLDVDTSDTAGGMLIVADGLAALESDGDSAIVDSATARLDHAQFVVTEPTSWRLTGTFAQSGSPTTARAGLAGQPEGGEAGAIFGAGAPAAGGSQPVTGSGTLAPGTYSFFLEATAGNCATACQASFEDVRFELGPAFAVTFDVGPPAISTSHSATFAFSASGSPPTGRFECRLDTGSFTPCVSPTTVDGLGDGDHVFAVRYHPDGQDPGSAIERRWRVDATGPDVIFDGAPSGDGNGPDADIAFHSTEPDGAAFRCKADDGQRFDCSSPHRLTGLSPGAHSFTVETFDAAGNGSPARTVRWGVGGPAPPPQTLECAAGTSASAGFGVVRVVARGADACFADEPVDGRPAKVARGPVALNGISLVPDAGTRIIVSERLGDGLVRADGGVTIGIGALTVHQSRLELDGLVATTGRLTKELALAEGALSLAGLPVLPGMSLELSDANGGQAKVTLRVTLPRVFSPLPGQEARRGVTVELAPTVSNDAGLTVAGRVKLSAVQLYGLQIKDLDLAYDHGSGALEGSFGVVLAEQTPPGLAEPTLTARIAIAPQATDCALSRLALEASSLNKPIGNGVFLQRLGGGFECVREDAKLLTKLTASAGVSLGPRIAIGSFELEALSLDGTATLRIPVERSDAGAYSLELAGSGKIVDLPVAQQRVKVSPFRVDVDGSLDLTLAGYGARLAMVNSFVDPDGFNLEYRGEANLLGLTGSATGLVSTAGFAACVGAPGSSVGFGRRWGGELHTFGGTCDIGPFRDPAVAAQRAGARAFRVSRGTRLKVLAIRGTAGAPAVIVSGPGARQIATPIEGGPVRRRDAWLAQDAQRRTTFVVLFDPPAGRWTVATPSGAAVGLRTADGLPPILVRTQVSGRGARRTLRWAAGGLAGGALLLVERGPGRSHVLRTTRRARGKLRFTPDPAMGRRHAIDVVVTRGGLPRLRRTTSRFTVAGPRRPGTVRGLRLTGRTLTWKRAAGAARYVVAITGPDRTTSVHRTRRARVTLRGLPKRGTIRADVVGLDALGRPGRAASARLALGRPAPSRSRAADGT